MATTSLPPGVRFRPTDAELVLYYLKRKIMGRNFKSGLISELSIYKYSPWELPDKCCLGSKDLEWYFFCPNERKYTNGSRMNRATVGGYWKSTGKDRHVTYNDRTVGMAKTLVFHIGRPPKGERTDWVMHEYRMLDKELADAGVVQDAYVVCKVFHKSGLGTRKAAECRAPFNEDDYDDDGEMSAEVALPPSNDSVGASTSSDMFLVQNMWDSWEIDEGSFPPALTSNNSYNLTDFGILDGTCQGSFPPALTSNDSYNLTDVGILDGTCQGSFPPALTSNDSLGASTSSWISFTSDDFSSDTFLAPNLWDFCENGID